MKEKGFTLIELLAVIVVLAIIALIATPMVLNTIEKAREGAAKASAETYMRAIEEYAVKSQIDSSKPQLQAGVKYQLSSTKYEVASLANPEEIFINDLIDIKGDKPESGYVIVSKSGTVESMEMVMNDYPVACASETCEVVKEDTVYESYKVGDAVTIDGVGYHVTKTSTILDEYVTLLRDESIGTMAFDENGGIDFETSTLKTYLNTTYKETFGDKEQYIKEITLLEFANEFQFGEEFLAEISFTGIEEGTYMYLYENNRDEFFEIIYDSTASDGFARTCFYNEETQQHDNCIEFDQITVENFWTKTPLSSTGDTLFVGVTKNIGINIDKMWYSWHSMTSLGLKGDPRDYDEDGNVIGATVVLDEPVRPVVVISKKALD